MEGEGEEPEPRARRSRSVDQEGTRWPGVSTETGISGRGSGSLRGVPAAGPALSTNWGSRPVRGPEVGLYTR